MCQKEQGNAMILKKLLNNIVTESSHHADKKIENKFLCFLSIV